MTQEQINMTEFLLWDGTLSNEGNIASPNIVAKTIYNPDTKKYRCFIKKAKGFLYNPMSPKHSNINSRSELHYKWRPVTETTLQQYILFVQTKNELYYKKAEREKISNG